MATPAPQMWYSSDGKLFESEADADDYDSRQSIYTEIEKGFDPGWNGKQPREVIDWLITNYDFSKRLTPTGGGVKAIP